MAVSILGVVMIIIILLGAYKLSQDKPEVANIKVVTPAKEKSLKTTTPVIGDKEVDTSINNALDNVLNEDSLDSELADVDLALTDEVELDEINNLVNDNEL